MKTMTRQVSGPAAAKLSKKQVPLSVRPSELMCILCRLGAGRALDDLGDKRLTSVLGAIRKNPWIPLTFRMYAGQADHGADPDAPDGVILSILRDITVMNKCFGHGAWVRKPGLGMLLFVAGIGTGVCGNPLSKSKAWRGCRWAGKGYFEKGAERLRREIQPALIPHLTLRTLSAPERAEMKRRSVASIFGAPVLRLFPRHLQYLVAHYGSAFDYKMNPMAAPLPDDELIEVGDAMRRHPDIPVMLVPDHCMVCPSCASYDPSGPGLCGYNHCRDITPFEKIAEGLALSMDNFKVLSCSLEILKTLGLDYYQKVPAHCLIRLTGAKMTGDHIAFTYKGAPPSYWAFQRGIKHGMGFLEAYDNPLKVIRRVRRLLGDPRAPRFLNAPELAVMRGVVGEAAAALRQGDRPGAYRALIREWGFWNGWKMCLEGLQVGYARLPKRIRIERREEAGVPIVTARRVVRPIAGGAAAEPTVEWTGGFRSNADRPEIAQTAVRAFYDRNAMTVQVIGAEKDIGRLKSTVKTGYDLAQKVYRYLWHDVGDMMLIMLRPNPDQPVCYNFAVNVRGLRFGEKRTGGTAEFLGEADWQAGAAIRPGYWIAWIRFPFAMLGIRARPPHEWLINVHRFFGDDYLDMHSLRYVDLHDKQYIIRKIVHLTDHQMARLQFKR